VRSAAFMIRRNIQLDDGTPAWLLISQVEHARISGELTQAWNPVFPDEVTSAIAHHDDGWRAWEIATTLDPVRGCPLSFVEMPISDAIQIWSRSIEAASAYGHLAAAIVAGHFIGLAGGSEQATLSPADKWLRDMCVGRAAWLAEWQSVSPTHTGETAEK